MKTRIEIILETIEDFVRGTIPISKRPRYDATVAELKAAEIASNREELAQHAKSLPKDKRRGLRKAIKSLKAKGLI